MNAQAVPNPFQHWHETMVGLSKSYVHGVSTTPLLGETVGAHFDRATARWPDDEALVVRHQSIRWTYRQLAQEVDAFATGLLKLGLRPGDRVGIWSPNIMPTDSPILLMCINTDVAHS